MARTKQTARKFVFPHGDQPSSSPSVDALWPFKEAPAPMTTQQQELVAQEDRFRDLFVNNRESSELQDPHVLLSDIFAQSPPFQYQQEDADERAVPKILTATRVSGRKGPCFATKAQFLNNWNSFTNKVLDGLNWNNVFAAGGAVLANITNPQTADQFAASDIDLFLYGFTTDEEANKKLEHIFSVVSKNTGSTAQIIRSFRAVTILGSFPDYRHVQIILRLYKSPAEVLLGFDVDCCTVGFDGNTVWGMERFVRAVSKGYNLVNVSRRSLTYETRLRKYSKRGYAVAIPNLDKAQVDANLFKKSAADVQGLAKLLIYEYYELNPPFMYPFKSYSTHKIIPRRFQKVENRSDNMNYDNIDIVHDITGTEDSDYAEFIPWGPAWYSNTILNMLEYKDRASAFGLKHKQSQRFGDKKPEKQTAVHQHSYVTGIKGVIEGVSANFWCRFCKQKRPLEQGEDGKDVCGPLHWLKEYQVYQDLDRGFRRSFAGSFQPILQENWSEGVYAAGYQARDAPHPLKPAQSPVKSAFGSGNTLFGSPTSASGTDSHIAGGQRFVSQNQMLRNMRENFGAPRDSSATYGENVEAFGGKPSVDIFAQNVHAFGGGTLPFFATAVSDTPTKSTVLKNLNSPQKSASQPAQSFGSGFNNSSYNTVAAAKSAHTVPPTWWSLFGRGSGSGESQMNFTGQALLLVAALYRKGAITLQFKSELKDLVLDNDPLVRSVVEAFFIDNDLVELVDSFTRVLSIARRH